jgi:hypothetical protein
VPAAAIEVVQFSEDWRVGDARRPLSERANDDIQSSLRDRLFKFERRRLDEIDENIDIRLQHTIKGVLKPENGTGDHAIDDPEPQTANQSAAGRAYAGAKGVDVAKERGGGLIGRMSELGQPERLAPAHTKLTTDSFLQVGQMHAESGR